MARLQQTNINRRRHHRNIVVSSSGITVGMTLNKIIKKTYQWQIKNSTISKTAKNKGLDQWLMAINKHHHSRCAIVRGKLNKRRQT